VLRRIMCARIFDRFRGSVDPHDVASLPGESGGAISGPAARVQHSPSAGHPHRKCVSRRVLIPQIPVDLTRNHTLARELSQSSFLKVLVYLDTQSFQICLVLRPASRSLVTDQRLTPDETNWN